MPKYITAKKVKTSLTYNDILRDRSWRVERILGYIEALGDLDKLTKADLKHTIDKIEGFLGATNKRLERLEKRVKDLP